MPRHPHDCEDSGIIIDGNLPQYIIHECVETIIDAPTLSGIRDYFPWVNVLDFHFYHIKCPFSSQSYMNYYNKPTIIDNKPDWVLTPVLDYYSITDHLYTRGMMIKYSRGSKHGWLCVDPGCPYYMANNTPYFYI